MNAREAKTTANMVIQAAVEFRQNQKDTSAAIQETRSNAMSTQKLWKEGNKSRLIQIGVALIGFPEPTPITVIVGSGLVVAGAIQRGIKNQSIYMEDIPKNLASAFKEIYAQRNSLRL